MIQTNKKYGVTIALVSLVLFLPVIINVFNLFRVETHLNTEIHSAIESMGAILSLLIVVLIYVRFSKNLNEVDYPFVALSFLGMGIFDLIHSFLQSGNSFVFSHIISIFIGGFWFGFLALSVSFRKKFRNKPTLIIVFLLHFLLVSFLLFFPNQLPAMVDEQGDFTRFADVLNILAGILFFIGVYKLLQRFFKTNENEIFYIAIIGLFQGFSRLTFHWSSLGDFDWWIWHIIRLMGSFIVFLSILRIYGSLISELKHTNQTQKAILDAMPFGLVVVGLNKKIIQMNKTGYQMTGFSEEDFRNAHCFESICGADCNNCPVLNLGEKLENEEKTMVRKNGSTFPAIKSVVPMVMDKQQVLLEGFIDITQRVEARKKLELNEQKFKEIFDAVTHSILIFDLNSNLVEVNETATIQYSYSKEELLKINPLNLFHADSIPVLTHFFNELKSTKNFKSECIQLRKNGSSFYASINGTLVTFNEEPHYLAAVNDISEIKNAEIKLKSTLQDLMRSNKELEQFAYVSSHDLQEPLRKITNFSDILELKYKDKLDENGKRYIDKITRSSRRMQKLIDDLLSLSRINTLEKEYKKVDLNEVLKIVQQNLKEIFWKNSAKIIAGELPVIFADEKQMIQLFQQLISNALKFRSEESPTIQITFKDLGEFWQFSIQDNGIGFEMKYAERIFTVFQKLHSRNEYSGTGIGLTICRKIVDSYGGKIGAESEPGKGTKVIFSLLKENWFN